MKPSILLATAVLSLSAGVAYADSLTDNPPKSATICLDTIGRALPSRCKANASRIDQRYDICVCPATTMEVTAPVCPAGVRPPADSADFERERLKAVSHGSIMGATWQGQPMCVAARNSP